MFSAENQIAVVEQSCPLGHSRSANSGYYWFGAGIQCVDDSAEGLKELLVAFDLSLDVQSGAEHVVLSGEHDHPNAIVFAEVD